MDFPSRIRTRASRLDGGNDLLEIASRSEVRIDMVRRVGLGEKPVTALSKPMVDTLGLEFARNDQLRQLAGEIAAFVVESEHRCVRASGSRKINGDCVFTSGQPFRLPTPRQAATASVTAVVSRSEYDAVLRFPMAIAEAATLSDGDAVEIEALNGTIVVRPTAAPDDARRRAMAAALAIVEDSHRTLGDTTIRELLEEGRRG